MTYRVKSLHIYPIKSLQGIDISSAQLVDYGLQYDRQWMLVDPQHNFISQRSIPHMATLKTKIHGDTLIVSNGANHINLDLNTTPQSNINVTVWRDTVSAYVENEHINQWFSQQLDTPCQLVKLANKQKRLVDPAYAHNKESVGFADAFPLLVVSQSNIDLLNSKLEHPAEMNRFRPNIVIDGLPAHAEDKLHSIIINDIEIKLVKPCDRCTVPSVNQKTGIKRPDILRTLRSYRQFNKRIYFGMNGLHQNQGTIKINQVVHVID